MNIKFQPVPKKRDRFISRCLWVNDVLQYREMLFKAYVVSPEQNLLQNWIRPVKYDHIFHFIPFRVLLKNLPK